MELDLLEEIPPETIEPSEASTLDSNQEKEKDKKDRKDDEDKSNGDNGQPVAADFRFGPAQLWWVLLLDPSGRVFVFSLCISNAHDITQRFAEPQR